MDEQSSQKEPATKVMDEQSSQKEPAKKVTDEQEKLKQVEDLTHRFSSSNIRSMPKSDPAVSSVRKPVNSMKTNAIPSPKSRPVALLKTKFAFIQEVNPAPISKVKLASPIPKLSVPKAKPALIPTKVKIISPASVPKLPVPKMKPALISTKAKIVSTVPVPKVNPVLNQQPEGPVTRSRKAPRDRFSFMMPTIASMRRSVNSK